MTAETNAPGSKRFARTAHLLEIFRYEREKYKHSSRMILPAILLFFYLGFAYSMAPQYVLDSFSICSLVVFLLMLAMGVMYEDIIFPMIDQTVFIKTEEKGLLFGGRCLLVAYISLASLLLSTAWYPDAPSILRPPLPPFHRRTFHNLSPRLHGCSPVFYLYA